ncbi:serine/threonine-protein kinase [Amycolatopsis magusensis]|uniref:Serine/threonine protein kinase n=1 Tax=Amycolatopsis magusensis TaxID=882444 RepID=A0ABS4PMT9_9PSEU|nr:serine/threonine protein kinase [Amycolatopsis magusensis]
MVILGEDLQKPTYTILRSLNEGATDICHLAYHEVFERNVVQKTISLLGLEDSLAFGEPRLLDQFDHPNLAKVSEAQWDPQYRGVAGLTFIMPYYEGGSLLRALQESHPFSMGDAVSLTCQTLDALDHLHVNNGIVHRDIKPSNVFLSEDRRTAYVGDLGSAAKIDGSGYSKARGGTPLYLPPEYSTGHYSPAGDIYSTGMILLELVNGRLPYETIDQDEVERRNSSGKRALSERMLTPGIHVPDALRRIIRCMLNENPDRRPGSAQAAKRELQGVRHLDWKRDLSQPYRWTGFKAHRTKTAQDRAYEVSAQRITRGINKDQFKLTARWRLQKSDNWRGMPACETQAAEDDTATWRDFFKRVSEQAHRSAAK